MTTDIGTPLLCPLCGQAMTRRERAPDQSWLEAEYLCLDLDCLEFGIYRAAR